MRAEAMVGQVSFANSHSGDMGNFKVTTLRLLFFLFALGSGPLKLASRHQQEMEEKHQGICLVRECPRPQVGWSSQRLPLSIPRFGNLGAAALATPATTEQQQNSSSVGWLRAGWLGLDIYYPQAPTNMPRISSGTVNPPIHCPLAEPFFGCQGQRSEREGQWRDLGGA